MIKRFCDKCGKEYEPTPGKAPLSAVIDFGSTRTATVSVTYSTAGKNEPLDICKFCLIDAVRSLDTRPVAAGE